MRKRTWLLLSLLLVAMSALAQRTWDPVDEQRRLNPADGDWIHFRRTMDSSGYSPLRQINRSNVAQLELQWAYSMGDTQRWEPYATVVNGMMFLTDSRDQVHALDAATGDVIWVYQRERPEDIQLSQGQNVNRGVAFYEDLVLFPATDMTLVALDALTGEVVWEVDTGDYTLGYGHTSPPLIVGNKAILGAAGGERGVRGFIAAVDLEQGELLWRTYTVPEPGEPGSETWASHPLCAAAWYVGSYDPELDTFYMATGQPCPWGIPETGDGDRLYANSILALDPNTGEIKWHFAVNPKESYDHDTPFENILTDLTIDGVEHKVLIHTGKAGWGVVLDRETGDFLTAWNFGTNNYIEGFTDDGQVIYVEDKLPWPSENYLDTDTAITICPDGHGVRDQGATSYSASTGLLYIPAAETCVDMVWTSTEIVPGEWNSSVTGVSQRNRTMVPGKDYVGAIRAINPVTGELAWEYVTETGSFFPSAVLSTGGDIVFAGSADRWFVALDAETGELLWRERLNGSVGAAIMTYEVDGRQYVEVGAGTCATAFCPKNRQMLPDVFIPDGSGVIWVFALPEND